MDDLDAALAQLQAFVADFSGDAPAAAHIPRITTPSPPKLSAVSAASLRERGEEAPPEEDVEGIDPASLVLAAFRASCAWGGDQPQSEEDEEKDEEEEGREGGRRPSIKAPTSTTTSSPRAAPTQTQFELPASAIEAVLAPDASQGPFGFSVVGGRDSDLGGVFICTLQPESPAWRCGVMREGDEVLAVNGTHVRGLRYDEVIALIKAGKGKEMRLALRSLICKCEQQYHSWPLCGNGCSNQRHWSSFPGSTHAALTVNISHTLSAGRRWHSHGCPSQGCHAARICCSGRACKRCATCPAALRLVSQQLLDCGSALGILEG
jgi:hypothetical protein